MAKRTFPVPSREELLADVERRTEQLDRVQELARRAVADAGKERGKAVTRALAVFSATELAEALGVSRQRVYQLVRESGEHGDNIRG